MQVWGSSELWENCCVSWPQSSTRPGKYSRETWGSETAFFFFFFPQTTSKNKRGPAFHVYYVGSLAVPGLAGPGSPAAATTRHRAKPQSCGEMHGTVPVPLTFLLTGSIGAVSLVGLPQLAVACKEKDSRIRGRAQGNVSSRYKSTQTLSLLKFHFFFFPFECL